MEHPDRIMVQEIKDNPMLSLALDTIQKGKQALVFANTKASAEKCAETIAAHCAMDPRMAEHAEKIRTFASRPTKQCERLSRCLKKGIAFHHSGLLSKQRELIETHFKQNTIKIICCTPTLAAGVDMPAYRTIIKDLKRFSGGWGQNWIPVLEYEQMSGRAGRPGKEDFGESIIIAASDGQVEELESRYVYGEPEEIYSKLAAEPVLRTYLLSLVASGFVRSIQQIFEFFEKTFWAHQFGDMARLEQIIRKVLALLEEYEFIRVDGKSDSMDDFITASMLGDKKDDDATIKATLLGQRVSQLYLDPLTAHALICAVRRSTAKQCTDMSFLQMVCYTLEMRPLLSVRQKEYDTILEKLTFHSSNLLTLEPSMYEPEYEEYLRSLKTALLLCEWIEEKDEQYLLETYNARPGELRAKVTNADWLLYAAIELSKLLQFHTMVTPMEKIRFRLKYGVNEELLALLKLKNIGRVRARKLFANGIKDIGDVKNAPITTLVQILGKSVALDVKKQVGEDVSKIKVKENKRKGQISLLDFNQDSTDK